MPQIVIAGLVLAAAWIGGRMLRKALGANRPPRPSPDMMRNGTDAIPTLRRDPETGVYIPAEPD